MSKRNPNITIHCHPLSFIEEPERIRATRRGEVMHYALGWLARESGRIEEQALERAVFKAFAILDLDPGDWKVEEDFVKPLLRVFALPEFRAWFDPAATSLVEAEIMDAAGGVYRPDRIVLRPDKIEIIDFKVGKREEAHKEQVETYAGLLRDVFAGRQVAGYLVYIDEPAIVEVK